MCTWSERRLSEIAKEYVVEHDLVQQDGIREQVSQRASLSGQEASEGLVCGDEERVGAVDIEGLIQTLISCNNRIQETGQSQFLGQSDY